jgi:hypothetical protein
MSKAMMEMYVSSAEDVYYSTIDGEVFILAPAGRNAVYTSNSVGARIWDLADGSRKIKEIVAIICKEFETDRNTVSKDTREFIDDLTERHLLYLAEEKIGK